MLRPGGRISGYVIHVATGLSPERYLRAIELGPEEVGADGDPSALTQATGFEEVEQVDVTETFRKTCAALLAARERSATGLRASEGEGEFEEEQAKKRGLLEGIEEGLLKRSRMTGRKPLR